MSTEISRRETGAVQAAPAGLAEYLERKRDLVRSLYAPGASDLEFEHFLETCQTRGLNPLAKQIYLVMRWDKTQHRKVPVIQTSIDGYRLLAQRTGDYAGQAGPWWCGPDGVWQDVWLEDWPPTAARVGVLRRSFAEPLLAVARFASYAQTTDKGELTRFWAAMPDVMIAKVAEALALRRAFPEELSGIYVDEEMRPADDAPPGSAPPGPEPQPISEDQRRRLFAIAGERGVDHAGVKTIVRAITGQDSTRAVTREQYDRVVAVVEVSAGAGEAEDVEGEGASEAPAEGTSAATDDADADAAWAESARRDPDDPPPADDAPEGQGRLGEEG